MGSSASEMDSSVHSARGAAVRIAWRAALIGVLACGAAALLAGTHLYATAMLLAVTAVLVTADLSHLIERYRGASAHTFDAAAKPGAVRHRAIEHERQLEYLHSLLDTVSAALIIVRTNERIVLANRAARLLAGQPVDDLEAVAAIGRSAARELLALAPGARSIVSLADGRRVFASVSQFASPERETLRLIAIQRVTGELDAVELQAWHEMAHVLAHEMMNSLTPIASLSESLEHLIAGRRSAGDGSSEIAAPGRSERTDPELLIALEAIRRRSQGLIDFVERYRAVAELPKPRVHPVRLDELMEGVGRLLSARFAEKGIAYRMRMESGQARVVADPQMLEQAIINLLRNAADAVDSVAAPRIDVTCRIHDGRISIEVADNGCGVPEEKRDEIFVPFFTTKAGGSGVGLSLARQIALSHRGTLELRSNQLAGSVFILTLPEASATESAVTNRGL